MTALPSGRSVKGTRELDMAGSSLRRNLFWWCESEAILRVPGIAQAKIQARGGAAQCASAAIPAWRAVGKVKLMAANSSQKVAHALRVAATMVVSCPLQLPTSTFFALWFSGRPDCGSTA